MDDEQLAEFLNLTADEAKIIIPKIPPSKRAVYDKMLDVVIADRLGGEFPEGVIVCWDHSHA